MEEPLLQKMRENPYITKETQKKADRQLTLILLGFFAVLAGISYVLKCIFNLDETTLNYLAQGISMGIPLCFIFWFIRRELKREKKEQEKNDNK